MIGVDAQGEIFGTGDPEVLNGAKLDQRSHFHRGYPSRRIVAK